MTDAAYRQQPTKVEQTISAYADESITDAVVVCGPALVQNCNVPAAEAALAAMKANLGLPPLTPLHCRVIFNGSERRKSPWHSIPPERINHSIQTLCEALKGITLRPIIFVAAKSPIRIPGPPGNEQQPRLLGKV